MPVSQNSQHSGSLQFSSISENDAGTYQCIAENGFGQPAVDSIQILVKRKFVILRGIIQNKKGAKLWKKSGKIYEFDDISTLTEIGKFSKSLHSIYTFPKLCLNQI